MSKGSGEKVTYSAGGTELVGWAESGTGAAPRPGVLVVHEWWGLNDYVRGRVHQLAELGYEALAVDMYGGGSVATDPAGATELMSGVLGDIGALERRFAAGLEALKARPGVDPSKIAAIGYCFGGAVVLHAARIGTDISGVVSFHGSLGSFHKPEPGSVKARVLVCHGDDDALVPEEDIAGLKNEMKEAGANFRFESYPGGMHGFSNPEATAKGEKYGMPLKYDAGVDAKSWTDMQTLFAEIFA